ncbi:MAG: LysR family transcriptional regulator [Proteobacteria bacterium]|nr:LysR family transcriptional regulator [Pseudomonadota bacterium]
MINPVDLNYFIEAARSKNFSRAAEKLGITQPALSHSIKRVEALLKLKLFIRSKRGVELSATGQLLYREASTLLGVWNNLLSHLEDESKNPQGMIRLGCHAVVAQYLLPKFMAQFLAKYPKINFQIEHGLSRVMAERVFSSHLDIAIVVNPIRHQDFIIKEICNDRVSLWRHKKLRDSKLLMIEPSLKQTQSILKKLKVKRFQVDSILESSSLEFLAQMLLSKAGYAILPERVVDMLNSNEIEVVEDAPVFYDKICAVYKPHFRSTERGRVFTQNLLDFYKNKL